MESYPHKLCVVASIMTGFSCCFWKCERDSGHKNKIVCLCFIIYLYTTTIISWWIQRWLMVTSPCHSWWADGPRLCQQWCEGVDHIRLFNLILLELTQQPPSKWCLVVADVIEIKCYSGQLLALDSLQIWFDIGFVSSLTSWCWNSSVFFVWMQLVIGEPLGKGSSGQLYRGKYMSQDVAIKMIALVDGHNVDMDSDSLQACPASERLQTFKQEFSIMRWAL